MTRKSTLILAAFLAVIGIVFFFPSNGTCNWDFKHSIWGPAELLVHGQPPYQIEPPYGPYIAPWWPQIIGVNFWMGWLPCRIAARLWLVFELTGLGFSIWLLNDRKRLSPSQLGLILILLSFFQPIYFHIELGQFSLLFTTMMVTMVFFSKGVFPPAKMTWWMPLLIVLGAAKPQLTILIYPGIIASTYRHQGWHGPARLLGASLAMLFVCLLPLFVFHPGWVSGFLDVVRYVLNIQWDLPTPFVQLTLHLGKTGLLIWFLLFIASLSLSLYLWLRKGAKTGMLWSMALTPLVTTYCSSWDFTLLLPLFFWLFLNFQSIRSRAGLIVGMLLVDILQVIPRLGKTDVPDGSQWWIPPALLSIIFLSLAIERRSLPRCSTAEQQ